MIRSAPRRWAASTADSPTAPSPTTATDHARPDARTDRGVVAGAGDVGEREDRPQYRVRMPRPGDLHERCVSERNPDGLALSAVHAVIAVTAALEAIRLPARTAQRRTSRRCRVNGVTTKSPGFKVADIGADLVDDADELVADRAQIVGREAAVVPQVRPAHAGKRDADDRVRWVLDHGVRAFADREVAWAAEDRGFHARAADVFPRLTADVAKETILRGGIAGDRDLGWEDPHFSQELAIMGRDRVDLEDHLVGEMWLEPRQRRGVVQSNT